MPGAVIQIDGFDPVAGAPAVLRAASHDDAAVCHLGGELWWPALSKLPSLRYDLFDGAFGAQISTPASSLTLQTEPWEDFGRYMLADARLQLWTGDAGSPWAQWTRRFDGRVSAQPRQADGQAQIEFAVDDRWLDQALLATYAGTTGAEGSAELKGQVKPLALGAPRYVAGKLIDAVNHVFQLSGYGPIRRIVAALERLVRFGPAIADYPTYAALVAATVPAGTWATCQAQGLARLGAPPAGQISFLVEGDAAGPDGWARRPGQLVRRLALLSGGAGRIDDVSLDALDQARPYDLSIDLDEQTTARGVIQQIAASVNAVAGVSWLGKLFVLPIGRSAAQVTLAADGSALPAVTSVEQIAAGAPWRKVAITAERAWTVHQLADIAFTAALIEVGDYAATTVYREGNIVSTSDGSRWLYASEQPASGSEPGPANPVWRKLSGSLEAVYADGTPIEDLKPAMPGATAGAPAGSNVGGVVQPDGSVEGGRLAEELNALADLNGRNILGEILRGDALAAFAGARTTLDDKPIGTVFAEHRSAQEEANRVFASNFTALGAKNAAGTGWIFDADAIEITGRDFSARSLSALTADVDGYSADITDLQEILIDPTGATARWVMVSEAEGNIGGLVNTVTKERSDLVVYAQTFKIVNPNGGQPFSPFQTLDDGTVVMGNVEVQKIKIGAVTADSIALNGVTKRYFWLAASLGGTGAAVPDGWGDFGLTNNKAKITARNVPAGGEVSIRIYINAARTGGDNDRVNFRLFRYSAAENLISHLETIAVGLSSAPAVICYEWTDLGIGVAGDYQYVLQADRIDGAGAYYSAKMIVEVGKR